MKRSDLNRLVVKASTLEGRNQDVNISRQHRGLLYSCPLKRAINDGRGAVFVSIELPVQNQK